MPWKKSEPVDQRREFALKALGTLNFRALCEEYGISPKTGYKWRERFLRQGLEGMEEDSRRPRSSPKQLSEGQVCEIVKQAGASTLGTAEDPDVVPSAPRAGAKREQF
jgi:transposase